MLTAFVGTNSLRGSQGIYTLAIDEHTADMKIVRTIPAENSSYLCIDKDEKHLYATIESNSFHGIDGGGVSAYQIDEDGNLTFINEQPTYGKLPCYVDVERLLVCIKLWRRNTCMLSIGTGWQHRWM